MIIPFITLVLYPSYNFGFSSNSAILNSSFPVGIAKCRFEVTLRSADYGTFPFLEHIFSL